MSRSRARPAVARVRTQLSVGGRWGGDPMASTLRLVQRAEDASGIARGRGRPHRLVSRGRLAVRPGAALQDLSVLRQVARPPLSPAEVPRTFEQAVGAGWTPQRRHVHADAVALARLSRTRLRARVFYLGGTSPLSLGVHARPLVAWRGERRLLAGAAVQAAWPSGAGLVVPRVVAAGSATGVDWVAEELLIGRHPTRREWQRAGPRLALALLESSLSRPVQRRPIGTYLRPDALDRVGELLADQYGGGPGQWPFDPARVMDLLRSLADTDRELLVGACHGDPVPGNVLLLPDGALGLVDWELAGPRPVAHDVVKVLLGLANPLRVVDDSGSLLRPLCDNRTAPWSAQLSVALVQQLAHWRQHRLAAARSGRSSGLAIRERQRLGLLADLLEHGPPGRSKASVVSDQEDHGC